MALPSITIPNFSAAPITVYTPNSGRQAAADSAAIALSTEDKTQLDALVTNSASVAPVTVVQPADSIAVAPTVDTAIYAAGDVLCASFQIPGATQSNAGGALLVSLFAMDKSKQNPQMTLYFFSVNNANMGAVNAAASLTDGDAVNLLSILKIVTGDWVTLANNSYAQFSGPSKTPNLVLKAAAGETAIYCIIVLDAGTPTFALGDLVFHFGLAK
jgi:hypothetical protein